MLINKIKNYMLMLSMHHLFDKTLKIFPGLFHETMNEEGEKKTEVLNLVKDWLNKH